MVLTVSTSYASGTVASASGTTINLATGTAVSAWIGRAFRLNTSISGRGGQWREITAVNSSTQITIAEAWKTDSAIYDAWELESLPQSGDAFHISHTWDDIDDTTNVLKVDSRLYRNVAGLTLSSNVCIYDKNRLIDWSTPTQGTSKAVTIGQAAAIIQVGGQWIFDYSTITATHNIFGTDVTPAGDLILDRVNIFTLGPSGSIAAGQGPFIRANRSDAAINRFIDCNFDGPLSGRVRGTRSAVLRNLHINARGTLSPLTTQSPVGIVSNNRVIDSEQAFYWFWDTSGSGTIRSVTAENLSVALVSINNFTSGSTSTSYTLTVMDAEYDESANLFSVFNTSSVQTVTNKTGRLGFTLAINAVEGETASAGGRTALFDNTNTSVLNEVSADGSYTDAELILRTYNLNTNGAETVGIAVADPTRSTLKAPYLGKFRQYGYQFLNQTFSAESTQSFTWYKSTNLFVSAADAATALAVINPTTANEIYDHAQATYAESSNMQYEEHILTFDGVTLTFDLDVALNSAATSETYDFAGNAVTYANITNGTFQTLTLGPNRILTLGDYSAYASSSWSLPATATINVDAAPASLDLSNWEFANGASFEITDGGSVTIAVANQVVADQLEADKLETSGSITFTAPVDSLVITGFPTANNANGVAPDPVLGILDASDESWITGFDTSSPEYNGDGSFTIIPGNYAADITAGTNIYIVGDAVGWRRTPLIEIDTANPPDAFNIGNNFEELTDQDGGAIVGNSAACTGLSYSQPNARFELASDSGGASNHYDFDGVVYQQELLTSNLLGLQNFDTDILRQIRYISNPRYKQIILPPTLSISATEDATTSPIVADFTVIRIDGTDPFEHGLDSTAVGLSDRPEVRVNFQVAIALDPEQVTWLETLYNATESGTGLTAFSTTALANAPSGGGGDATVANQTTIINHLTDIKGPTWTTTDSLEAIRDRGDIAWITATGFSTLVQADIRTALGVASANLDAQLGDIPTVAEFEARTLPSADYFDPSANEVTVGSNNDKSGYSLTQSFPANFANLGISAEGYINRVVTNSDMRGTDGALLADSYTAPDNTAIADIKTKTDQLTFTVANQVDSNALTGGGGDDAETIFAYFSGQGYTATRAGYLDKLSLPGTLTQTSDLPANFADLAIAETTGLVSIGSLPTIPTNWLTAAGIAADAIAEIQSGLSTLTEASVRSAVGLSAANLDTQLAAIGTDIDAVLVDTGTSIPNTLTTLQTSVNDLPDEVAAQSAIAQLIAQSNQMSQSLGRVTGYTATVLDATDEANGYVLVEDGLGATVFRQTTIKNGDGSVTVSLDA